MRLNVDVDIGRDRVDRCDLGDGDGDGADEEGLCD